MQNLPAPYLPSQHADSPPPAGFQECRHCRIIFTIMIIMLETHHNGNEYLQGSSIVTIIYIHTIVTTNSWNSRNKTQGLNCCMGSHWLRFVRPLLRSLPRHSPGHRVYLAHLFHWSPPGVSCFGCKSAWIKMTQAAAAGSFGRRNPNSMIPSCLTRKFIRSQPFNPVYVQHLQKNSMSSLTCAMLTPCGIPNLHIFIWFARFAYDYILDSFHCNELRPWLGNPFRLKMSLSVVHGCARTCCKSHL